MNTTKTLPYAFGILIVSLIVGLFVSGGIIHVNIHTAAYLKQLKQAGQ